MQIRPLWQVEQPDLANRVVHLTGRTGQVNANMEGALQAMSAQERLEGILTERRIRAYAPFWSLGYPCACFSEATQAGIDRLITGPTRRYKPWGVGFTKQFIFAHGGGPAYYIRGDQWGAFAAAALPLDIKALATLYWPGANPTQPGGVLPHPLGRISQFAYEREWRVPVAPPADSVTFAVADIALVISPSAEWLEGLPNLLGVNEAALASVERVFRPMPDLDVDHDDDDDALRMALGLEPWEPV